MLIVNVVNHNQIIKIKELYCTTKQGEGKIMVKDYSMTTIMDLSFPGQRTATANLCNPHDSVYMPGPRAGKSENSFFRYDT